MSRAGAAAPLIDLDLVALDTETTGLDLASARIVQVAALRMRGADMLGGDFETLVDPGEPIPVAATRIHGLADADVAGAPGFAVVAPRLASFLGEAAIVGHSTAFDLAMLRREADRAGLPWREPRSLDVGLLAAALEPGRVDVSLDALALSFGVGIEGRHSARGDAAAAARVFAALTPRLLAAGVRTLGEAEAFQRRAAEFLARQERAGWLDRSEKRPDFARAARAEGGRRAIDGHLYRRRLRDEMSSPAISIRAGATLKEAAETMSARGFGCLLVETGGAPGFLSERDLLSALAERGGEAAGAPVSDFMSPSVVSAPAETFLYRALGLMARRNLRYLGVSGAEGRIEGIFTLRTLLRERALASLALGDEIAAATDPRELARAQSALPGLAAGLLADGLAARDVAAVIAAEGRAMTARAAELAEAELGPAPAPYALLVLGSAGRGECLLAPDQDNALAIDDGYPGDLDDGADWFRRFAERVNAILDLAGVPLCKGGVMARNRPWRRRLPEWREAVSDWAARPDPAALLNVDIFYDFAPAHVSGPEGAALAEELRRHARETARRSPGLLRALGERAGGHAPPLGLFGRIRRDEAGRVDLKAGALLPITAGARAMALRHGVEAASTPERLLGAAEAAGSGEADARLLAEVHGFALRLLLAQQIADIEAGIQPSNRVSLEALTREDAARLADALRGVALIGEMVRDLLEGAR